MEQTSRAEAASVRLLGEPSLETIFELKYGPLSEAGWGPRMRRRFCYYNPDDHYELLMAQLVCEQTSWLDVGCGRDLFPNNRPLAERLSSRCKLLVGIDPDQTLEENPFVHEHLRGSLESYQPDRKFDLISMRMVAEHVADPHAVAATLAAAAADDGLVVIYTVNARSPVPLLTRCMPMALRHRIKRILWRSEEKDTFPTLFAMNTRARLAQLMADAGFCEHSFQYLDDCRTTSRFRVLQYGEMQLRRLCKMLGMRYPENCLLGVYRRNRSPDLTGDPQAPILAAE